MSVVAEREAPKTGQPSTRDKKQNKKYTLPFSAHLVELLLKVSHLRGLQRPRHHPQRYAL